MKIEFRQVGSPISAAKYLASLINAHLDKRERILWLVPGGSAAAVACLASQLVTSGREKLTVGLTDERFGPPGHPDSNWRQLERSGFHTQGITKIEVLRGAPLESTVSDYENNLSAALEDVDFCVGLFGVGTDNHTAGIKPGSPAVSSLRLVEAYKSDDFTRLTVTPKLIAKLDEAVVYAIGEEKRPAVMRLQKDLPLELYPSQALKTADKLIIYNG